SVFGGDGGGGVLRVIGDWLKSQWPDAGLARLGGEDFGAVLAINDIEEARDKAEALRAGLETLMPVVNSRNQQVSASVGASFVQEDSRSSLTFVTKSSLCCK